MNTNSNRFGQLLLQLQDKEYRDIFVDSTIRNTLALQIRLTREQRGWTQEQLGQAAGMAQETVSLLENPSYGKFTLRTLKRIASAFDVALVVRFVPFSQLAEWTTNIPRDGFTVPAFESENEGEDMDTLPRIFDMHFRATNQYQGINVGRGQLTNAGAKITPIQSYNCMLSVEPAIAVVR
ncbi:MAG: helix-turn-helix transcriptional regulator [Dehalococcoidia bacterium]